MDLKELLVAQAELERLGVVIRGENLEKRMARAQEQERAGAELENGALMRRVIVPFRDFLAETDSSRGRGRPSVAAQYLRKLGANRAAFLTVGVVLNHARQPEPCGVNYVGLELARRIIAELKLDLAEEQEPVRFAYEMERLKSRHAAHRQRSMMAAVHRWEIDDSHLEGLSKGMRLKLAVPLVHALADHTGIVEIVSDRVITPKGAMRMKVVRPTAQAEAYLDDARDHIMRSSPFQLPILAPPRPWTGGQRGAYLFALADQNPLVRASSKAWTEHVEKADLPMVREALDILQSSRFIVDERVLSMVTELAERGGGRAGVPATDVAPEPVRDPSVDHDHQALKDYKQAKTQWYADEEVRKSKLRVFKDVLAVAKRMHEYRQPFHFGYSSCFRGRVYPLSDLLTVQGDQMAKALLRSADPEPLGPNGFFWMTVHGANVIGKAPEGSKYLPRGLKKTGHWTYEERSDWVEAHADEIVGVAADPWGNRWWMDVDEPLLFYAFACEFAEAWRWKMMGEEENFVSGLIGSVDGAVNGTQHLSAATRDRLAGMAVNLTANDTPHDLYQQVADKTNTALGLSRDEGDTLAELWAQLNVVDRSLAKIPVMTSSYGSGVFGYTLSLLEKLQEMENWQTIEGTLRDTYTLRYQLSAKTIVSFLRGIYRALKRSGVEPGVRNIMAVVDERWQEFEDPRAAVVRAHRLLDGDVLAVLGNRKCRDMAGEILKVWKKRDDWAALKGVFEEWQSGPLEMTPRRAVRYLAKRIDEALQGCAPGAHTAMKWMQDCVRILAKHNIAAEWTVPITGFPVKQEYYKREWEQFDTHLFGGIRVQPRAQYDTDEVCVRRQVQGISANVTHSLDACALMLTVLKMADAKCHAYVHDSYGTTFGSMEKLYHAARSSFVELYEGVDVLDHLYQQWQALLPEGVKLPDPAVEVPRGDLDIREVLRSDYFFA